MSVFDEVKSKLKIEDMVAGTVTLKKQGRAMQGFCPFHDNHRTPALAVWPDTQTWKCFAGCGGGDVFDWVEKRDGLDRRGALELLARMASVELGSMTPEQFKASEKRKEASKIAGAAAEFFRRRLWGYDAAGLTYARSRGWTDETIKAAGLGYFGRDWDELRKHLSDSGIEVECPAAAALVGLRGNVAAWGKKWGVSVSADEIAEGKIKAMPPGMIIYCHAEGRNVVYVSGRRLEGEVKSWNPPSNLFGERRPYFNSHFRHGKSATLVEGQGDAVTLDQWGLAGIALAGCSADKSILSVLVKCENLAVALDSDQAGIAAATGLAAHGAMAPFGERVKRSVCWRVAEAGLSAARMRVVTWPSKDANETLKASVGADDVAAMMKGSPTWVDTLIEFAAESEHDEDERGEARLMVFDLLARCNARWVIERKKKFAKSLDYDLDTFEHLLVEARRQHGIDEAGRPMYSVSNGRVVHNSFDRMGNPYEQVLLNGVLNIERDIVVDDGEEQQRIFTVGFVRQDKAKFAAGDVDAKEFSSMNWLPQLWGTRAILPAGQSVKDHLRVATMTLSQEAQTVYRYAHTGWRQVDGHMVFLSPAGGVGMDGVNVQVPDPLMAYGLPVKPENVAEAMRASLRFLEVGDLWVTIPLLAAMYHAPLAPIVPPSFTLWLYGTTGTMKSTATALAMCHYGKFSYNTPPASWSGTEVGLRTIAFVLKDMPLWIDDFVSQSTIRGNDELIKKADGLLRDWGNRAGGVKGTASGGLRKVHKPRGLIINTAEMLPPGQSITARLFAVEVRPGMLEGGQGSKLTEAQTNDAPLYPHAMGGYTMWLAEHWEALKSELPKRYMEMKDRARVARSHMRGPENVATLAIGFEMMTRFARECGAIGQEEAEALNTCAWDYLTSIGEEQQEIVQVEENPVEMFLRALDQLVAQGAIYFKSATADSLTIEHSIVPENRIGGAEFVGYYTEDWLYLLPDVSYRIVVEFYRRGGRCFTDSAMGLKSKLKEMGALQVDPSERFRCKLWTGTHEAVWTLKVGRAYTDTIMASICSKAGITGITGITGSEEKAS